MFTALIIILSLLLYAWLVYPVVMLWLGRRRVAAHSAPPTGREGELPSVAILFSAHNEAAVILKRLENLAQLDYPADKLQVFAGIDGGSDNTAEIALAWAQSHPNVHVVVSETNHGKTAMLKRLVRTVEEGILPRRHPASPGNTVLRRAGGDTEREKERECCGNFVHGNTVAKIPATLSGGIWKERGEVQQATPLLVFTDANTFFAPDALMNLVAPFEDPEVGGVCGKLVFEKQKSEVRSQNVEECLEKKKSSNATTRIPLPEGLREFQIRYPES